jgi:hypothetical protein
MPNSNNEAPNHRACLRLRQLRQKRTPLHHFSSATSRLASIKALVELHRKGLKLSLEQECGDQKTQQTSNLRTKYPRRIWIWWYTECNHSNNKAQTNELMNSDSTPCIQRLEEAGCPFPAIDTIYLSFYSSKHCSAVSQTIIRCTKSRKESVLETKQSA